MQLSQALTRKRFENGLGNTFIFSHLFKWYAFFNLLPICLFAFRDLIALLFRKIANSKVLCFLKGQALGKNLWSFVHEVQNVCRWNRLSHSRTLIVLL